MGWPMKLELPRPAQAEWTGQAHSALLPSGLARPRPGGMRCIDPGTRRQPGSLTAAASSVNGLASQIGSRRAARRSPGGAGGTAFPPPEAGYWARWDGGAGLRTSRAGFHDPLHQKRPHARQ